jgi:hypothetical protein
VVEGGQRALINDLAGRTLIDATVHSETDELLLLSYEGDTYGALPEQWELSVHRASVSSPQNLREIATWSTAKTPRSIAFFEGHLFIGAENGTVFRASGSL